MRLGILTALLLIFHMQNVFHCSPDVVPGYLDFDNLPDTNFSCEGKVIGGYYADVETGCQMFHVCTIGQKGETTDIKFLCLNGTVFDQETRVCERVDEVDCSKTEGFYNLNLELYGNSAALSFPEEDAEGEEDDEEEEEEGEEETESEENTETSDTSSNDAGLKHTASTSKPPTPSSIPNPNTAHPASTTTPKTPVHPFVPTSTYKPNQHLTHFHTTTVPSIAAFLAINNAFSSSTSNQEGNKFTDNSSHYDEDEGVEEDEEEEEEDDSNTDHPGTVINGGTSHHFPVTTHSSRIRPVSPGHHNIPQHNVKVHGTGESGVILNQSNRQQPQNSQSTSIHSAHLYGHQTPLILKDTSAHSKHQLNTQFILSQQRENDNKQHHGFKPIPDTDNKNQFLFSSTTRQPPVLFTTKSPSGYSAPAIEPFAHHSIGTQQTPTHATQRPPNSSPFPPQTNAHQVPHNPLVHQIHANIANNGGYVSQTIQISPNPLTFQFNSKGNNRQLFTTPSVAVVATTSSTSSSSSARTGTTGKVGNISPVISLTSSIGNAPKGSGVTNNSSVSVRLFAETTPPNSYDEYQEGDVHSDPFFRDVPKIAKPSTTLKTPSPTRHRIVRKKREALKKILIKTKPVFLSHYGSMRYKRKALAQAGLPTEVFGTGEGRHRSRSGGSNRRRGEALSLHTNAREQIQLESHSRGANITKQLGSKQNRERSRSNPFVAVTYEDSTLVPEVLQQAPQYSGTMSDISSPDFAPKHLESTALNSSVRTENHQGYERTLVKGTRPYKQNAVRDMYNHHPSEMSGLSDHTESFQRFSGDPKLHVKSTEKSPVMVRLVVSTSGSAESSYGKPEASSWVGAKSSQMLQNFTKNVPISRTRGREEHRHLQQQPSQSNLVQEGRVESHSRRSRQRSGQKIRVGATGSAHENDEHLPRRPLTFQPRGDTDPLKAASIIDDNRYSDSKIVDERTLYSHHASPHSRIRNHRRKLDISSRYQDVARPDSNKIILPSNETHMESGAATKLLGESPFHPQTSVPKTNFTCADKIPGGYYADLEADCQLFHICSMGRHGKITDNMFLCGPGTRFDQRSRTCQARDLVDCSLSASFYYLNSHFQFPSPDNVHDTSFEPQKIRTRRTATKELPHGSKQPQYNIDSLPETSFTCGDKPQDGLYADVETQCQVFHLCRTISGVLTLESSFVCPPGTVFNQPEGNCDTKNEVDCALYSTPEHIFKKTAVPGTRNQGLKPRQKRNTLTHRKLSTATIPKKDAVYKHVMDKNYRMKRETKKETFDYYDYVDDNYEAHAVKPISRVTSPADDKVKQSTDNTDNSEDYVYDSAPVSAEQEAKEDIYLLKSPKNEKDDQKYIVFAAKDQGSKGPEPSESFVAHTTESTLPLHKESEAAAEKITPVSVPYQLVLQNKTERIKGDKLDYVYEYEYNDEDTAAIPAPPDLQQTNSELDDTNVKDYVKSVTSDPRYGVENSYKFLTVETNDHIKNDAKFATVTHKFVDTVTLPTSTTKNIIDINRSGGITTNKNLEAKIIEKVVSANGNMPAGDYEYEYYYDEDHSNSSEAETDSGNKHLPSVNTETDSGNKHLPSVNTETDSGNKHLPSVNTETDSGNKHLPSVNIGNQPVREANGHDVTADSGDESDDSAHHVVTEEIKLQIHRPSVKVANVSGTHKTVNFNGTLIASEKLNVAPVQFSAKTEMNFGIDDAGLNEKESTSTERGVISELFETYKNARPSHAGGSTAYAELSRPMQVEMSLSQPTQRTQNLTAFTDIALQNFSTQIPSQAAVKSILEPLKTHNIFRNNFSTLVPPPFLFHSRGALNLRKFTIQGNGSSVATNFTENNVTEDEGKPRTSYRFRLAHNENHVTHIPQESDVSSATTAPVTSLFSDDSVIDDKDTMSQHMVPSTQSSEMSRSEQNSSTAPHVIFSSNDEYNQETEIPIPFAKSSSINADTVDTSMYSNSAAVYSPTVATDSTLSSKLPMFPRLGVSTPSSSAQYDSHNFTAVDSSVPSNDNIMLNHFGTYNSSLDHAFRNIFQLNHENQTSSLVFSINNLAVPVTATSSALDIPSSEPSEVMPNTSPSSHLGYTLSAVTSQPSISADPTHATGFVCTGRELHQYHPDTEDCRMFHYCSPGFHDRQVLDFRFICQNGTAFKADTHKCEKEFLVPNCTNMKI